MSVADDGTGGADAAHGTGLRGVRRRLASFDLEDCDDLQNVYANFDVSDDVMQLIDA